MNSFDTSFRSRIIENRTNIMRLFGDNLRRNHVYYYLTNNEDCSEEIFVTPIIDFADYIIVTDQEQNRITDGTDIIGMAESFVDSNKISIPINCEFIHNAVLCNKNDFAVKMYRSAYQENIFPYYNSYIDAAGLIKSGHWDFFDMLTENGTNDMFCAILTELCYSYTSGHDVVKDYLERYRGADMTNTEDYLDKAVTIVGDPECLSDLFGRNASDMIDDARKFRLFDVFAKQGKLFRDFYGFINTFGKLDRNTLRSVISEKSLKYIDENCQILYSKLIISERQNENGIIEIGKMYLEKYGHKARLMITDNDLNYDCCFRLDVNNYELYNYYTWELNEEYIISNCDNINIFRKLIESKIINPDNREAVSNILAECLNDPNKTKMWNKDVKPGKILQVINLLLKNNSR